MLAAMLAGSAALVQAPVSNQCWQKASLKAAGVDGTVCASPSFDSLHKSLPQHATQPSPFSAPNLIPYLSLSFYPAAKHCAAWFAMSTEPSQQM